MCSITENLVPEWKVLLSVCQNSNKERVLDSGAGLFSVFLRYGTLNLPEYC